MRARGVNKDVHGLLQIHVQDTSIPHSHCIPSHYAYICVYIFKHQWHKTESLEELLITSFLFCHWLKGCISWPLRKPDGMKLGRLGNQVSCSSRWDWFSLFISVATFSYPWSLPILFVPNIFAYTLHILPKNSPDAACQGQGHSNHRTRWKVLGRTGYSWFDKATGYQEGSIMVRGTWNL